MIDNKSNIALYEVKSAAPIDSVAARVTKKGIEYRPDKIIKNLDSAYPIDTLPAPKNCEDLTGLTFGRFVVVGYHGKGGKWVCRCSCGRYAVRRAKSIFNKENTKDRCEYCRQIAFIKREEHFRRTGKDRDIKEF